LAADGTLFLDAQSAVPVTAPSHSTILTGLYPPAHGVRDNGLFVLPERQITLAEILQARGYATAAAVGSYPLSSEFGLDQGFDLFDDHFTVAYEDLLGRRGPKQGIFFDERKAALVNDAVFPWLAERGDKPFFLWTHYFDPHQPHQPPAPYDDLYREDLYLGEIAYADESLGVLFDRLKSLGLWEDTLVVFTADHGEGRGEHGETTHSTLTYGATLHVPLIIRAPGRSKGLRVETRVGTVDIVPTILDLLGIEASSSPQGRSLVPFLDGIADPEPNRPLYAETLAPRTSHGLGELRVLFQRDWKYIHGPRPELYDLSLDPGELHDLVTEEPNVAAGLRRELETFLAGHVGQDSAAVGNVDAETLARLEALGYVQSATVSTEISEQLTDSGVPPRDRVGDINDLSAAKHFLNSGNYEGAFELAEGLLERAPSSPYYLQVRAIAEFNLGRPEDGLRTLAEIRRVDPRGLPAEPLLFEVARFLVGADRVPEALVLLEDSQSVRPSAPGQWYLASLRALLGEPIEEEVALRRALEIDAQFSPARVDFAVGLARGGDIEGATEEFKRSIRDMPYYSKAHYNFGTLLFAEQQYQEALRAFRRALEIEPEYSRGRLALVLTAIELGLEEEAEAAVAEMESRSPGSTLAVKARQAVESAF
jgi:arylsulfatase A-like enzyme